MVQLSHPYLTTGKTISLTIRTFVSKVMSLLFNMLSRFVIAFLPRSKCLLISWLQSPSKVILEPKEKICHCFCFSPFFLPWSDGIGCYDLSFLNLELKKKNKQTLFLLEWWCWVAGNNPRWFPTSLCSHPCPPSNLLKSPVRITFLRWVTCWKRALRWSTSSGGAFSPSNTLNWVIGWL